MDFLPSASPSLHVEQPQIHRRPAPEEVHSSRHKSQDHKDTQYLTDATISAIFSKLCRWEARRQPIHSMGLCRCWARLDHQHNRFRHIDTCCRAAESYTDPPLRSFLSGTPLPVSKLAGVARSRFGWQVRIGG
jgi:hypothetical protein